MKTIFAHMRYRLQKQQDVVLVTLVEEAGSAPRGTGAQMLVGKEGRIAGSIGGGAVEIKSVELAGELLKTGKSLLRRFSLRQEAGDIGMVCGGDVSAWFQYVPAGDEVWRRLSDEACAIFDEHGTGLFVQSLRGGAPSLLDENGRVIAGDTVPAEAVRAGLVDGYFSMELPKGERAVIFGAGHIARALVPILRSVGFRPIVFDCRSEYAAKEYFPEAEAVICGDYLRIGDYLTIAPDDYLVVMTHGHTHDFELQEQLLRGTFAYIGVIGSRAKTAAVTARLMAAGLSEDAVRQVHTPIGTRIKAVTPQEIAVSIAGEMIYERAVIREQAGILSHGCPMHA